MCWDLFYGLVNYQYLKVFHELREKSYFPVDGYNGSRYQLSQVSWLWFLKPPVLGGRSQDGRGIGRGDHFLFSKFIERTTERWTKFTKQLLISSSGHQAPRKAAHCLRREVGQGYWRLKRATRERGTETRPGKGVLLEEVSNHQETLALVGPGEVFKSRRAT